MTSRDFTYWLRGYLELSETESLTKEQLAMIKEHLNLVFKQEEDMDSSPSDDSKSKDVTPMRC